MNIKWCKDYEMSPEEIAFFNRNLEIFTRQDKDYYSEIYYLWVVRKDRFKDKCYFRILSSSPGKSCNYELFFDHLQLDLFKIRL